MKAFGIVLLLLLPAGAAAQEAPAAKDESHGVTVVKARWQKRFYNPARDGDPRDASSDLAEVTRARQDAARANPDRAALPLPPDTESPGATLRPKPGRASILYLYEVKVRNEGTKKIRSIVWEYVLFDPATRAEVGRHEFESKVGIDVGKSKSLTGTSSMPPASVVHVSKSDRETREQYAERVDIRRVVYEDGTVWERVRDK